MKKALERTHQSFDIEPANWHIVLDECKAHFGYHNYLQQYHLRSWVASSYTLFVRNDLLDDQFTTYLGLLCKIKAKE